MTVRKKNAIHGVITALITPFKNGAVDWYSLERVVRHQLDGGIHGFVINGTTGESPTLSETEREEIFYFVAKIARAERGADFPLVMGTGSNSTAESIRATQRAEQLGATAALVVVPYYNRPPQRGLFQHFQKIAECSKLPIILYNVPSRTVARLEAQTIIDLSHVEGIVGIKEATGDIEFGKSLLADCAPGFNVTSGDDASFLELTAVGGHGVISVASHLLPKRFVQWYELGQAVDDRATALEEFRALQDLNSFLYVEANPIGIKMALHLAGLIESPELRLPLVALTEPLTQQLKEKMQKAGLL